MTAPVLLIAFARPHHTRQVWEEIRQAAPEQLFVAIDAPREDRDEAARVHEVSKIVHDVDWSCTVKYLTQSANLGPGLGPRTAVTWFFDQVESGIILEDDTLPHPTFFQFASELLQVFADDARVASISGTSFAAARYRGDASYFASRYATTWGWATWRRSWEKYDPTIPDWADLRTTRWLTEIGGSEFADHWTNVFDMVRGDLDEYWDYQFQYSAWKSGAITLHPAVNLVMNIGQGELASHTVEETPVSTRREVAEMRFPLVHLPSLVLDPRLDRWIDRSVYRTRRSWRGRIFRGLTGLARNLKRDRIQPIKPKA